MSDPFLGEITAFGFNFPPRGWATCGGQVMPIAQNTALFSLLGTTYGGNGTATFALPDLRSVMPIFGGRGAGPGLSAYTLGEIGGTETHTLLQTEMPMHNHLVSATSVAADLASPSGDFFAAGAAYNTTPDTSLHPSVVGLAGSNAAHPNMPPYLVVNHCIALQGIYPSRA